MFAPLATKTKAGSGARGVGLRMAKGPARVDQVAGATYQGKLRPLTPSLIAEAPEVVGEPADLLRETPVGVKATLGSAGQPLPEEVRRSFSSRLDFDFGRVRVHTDGRAAESAKTVAARAYTVGDHIAFGAGQFAPETRAGRRLLGHELAHVVQQGEFPRPNLAGGPLLIQRQKVSGSDLPHERDPEEPRSLTEDLVPSAMGLKDLAREIVLVRAWLAKHGTTWSVSSSRLVIALRLLEAEQAFHTRMHEAKTSEERAQLQTEHRVRGLSNEQLSDKIVKKYGDMLAHSGSPTHLQPFPMGDVQSVQRLEKEQTRRRSLPVTVPATVAEAVEMMKEAWRLAEKERPPHRTRALALVGSVDTWLQRIAGPGKFHEHLKGVSFGEQMANLSVGSVKTNIHYNIYLRLKGEGTIGGWWELAINGLGSREVVELLQIAGREKALKDTVFYAQAKAGEPALRKAAYAYGALLAAPALVAVIGEVAAVGIGELSMMGVRALPQLTAWVGLHPILATELLTSSVVLAEKYSESGPPSSAQDLLLDLGLAYLGAKYADMHDEGLRSPGSGNRASPSLGKGAAGNFFNKLLMALSLGMHEADVMPRFSGGGGSSGTGRPTIAMVEGNTTGGSLRVMPGVGGDSTQPDLPVSAARPAATVAGNTAQASGSRVAAPTAASAATPASSAAASTARAAAVPRVNAPGLGESQIRPALRSGLKVDVAVQAHNVKTPHRQASGTAVQSAHMLPTSAMTQITAYSRGLASTILQPRNFHAAFDAGWKTWSHAQVAAGRTTVTVEEFLRVLDAAAEAVPQLRGRTSDTMSWLFRVEVYQTLGLSPSDTLRIPYS